MKPVRADFAPPRVPGRWHWLALAVLVTAAVATSGFVLHQRKALEAQRSMLERQAAERRAAVQVPKPAAPPPYERSAREMLAEHRLAWPEVLTALEATAMEGVTPTTVEISASDGTARVEVNFSDHARLLEYLEALNAGQAESRWVLVQTQVQTGSSVAVLQVKAVRR